jgi:hypothetical protein
MTPTTETTPLTELREIHDGLLQAFREGDERKIGFFEGRGFEVTRQMDDHPDFWDIGCVCATCLSYGDE